MDVEGLPAEAELQVGRLGSRNAEEGAYIYTYESEEHIVQARAVTDFFLIRTVEGQPDTLGALRFELDINGGVPRGCAVPNPVPVSVGASLPGRYINGVVGSGSKSIAITPDRENSTADVKCTLTRVK